MRLGILGGGQLAQMMTQAAVGLGLETAIYETAPDSPASRLTHHHAVGGWGELDAVARFAAGVSWTRWRVLPPSAGSSRSKTSSSSPTRWRTLSKRV
ncbi:MAG: hypothetical protein MUC99_12970 [Anaerolineae bacterium]|nr:hypothetical protein [Anaerolineae bacterium]